MIGLRCMQVREGSSELTIVCSLDAIAIWSTSQLRSHRSPISSLAALQEDFRRFPATQLWGKPFALARPHVQRNKWPEFSSNGAAHQGSVQPRGE